MLLTLGHFGFHFLCSVVNCLPTAPPLQIQNLQPVGVTGARRARMDNDISSESNSWDGIEAPLVWTKSGWLQGYIQKTIKGRSVAAFEGIPYGKSPSGKRRFRKPEPVDGWPGIRPALKPGPYCLQMDFAQGFRIHGVEDCLHLNVYTPHVGISNSRPKLPVIVFIHGGGFQSGISSDFGPAYLLDKDVVLVTINYRVGVLGFLSTGDDAASGNWGMKDQVLALHWVSQNIQNFGGDPSSVTIVGNSAGAASVGLQVVSKLSDGLFHKAICQSGTALNNWSIQNDTISNSKIIARGVRCPTDDSFDMANCLRRVSPNAIVARMIDTWKYLLISRLPFGPVIEAPGTIDAFLDEAPEVAYVKGHVKPIPMIMGFNKDEGVAFALAAFLTPFMMGNINRKFASVMSFGIAYDTRTDDVEGVSRKISDFYLKGQRLSYNNRRGWIDMFGDRTIYQGVYYGMQYHSTVAPTYGYELSFQEDISLLDIGGLDAKEWGIPHGEEMMYLFNCSVYTPLVFGSKEYVMSEFIINLWTNFARTGKPVYVDEFGTESEFWSKITDPMDIEILKLDKVTEMIKLPFKNRLAFWESLRLKDDPVLFPLKLS